MVNDPTLVVRIVTAIILLAAFTTAVLQFRRLIRSNRELHDWNRRKSAQDAVREYIKSSYEFKTLHHALGLAHAAEPVSLDTIEEKSAEPDDIRPVLTKYLNTLEWIAIGVTQGVYDEQVIKTALAPRFERANYVLSLYIRKAREEDQNPNLYYELECLADKWKSERTSIASRELTGRD